MSTTGPPEHDRGEAPNVVLICADQWRGDCLSGAGHPYVHTPYLDQLAGQGARFSSAYSATPTCVPARAALLTGQSQETHGLVGYTDGVPFELAHPCTTLPAEFRRAGYQTQAIGKMHVWPERSRLGFDNVILHDGFLSFARAGHRDQFEFFDDYVPWLRRQPGISQGADYFDHGVQCNSVVARPWDKAENLHPTNWLVSQAIEWLYRRDPTTPFFLYLSFHRPHPPYDPPAWAFSQYLDLPPYEAVVGNWEHHYDAYRCDWAPDTHVGQLDPRTMHRARAGYYGSMTQIDHQINRFRESLKEFGLTDNTVVVFTSDHGEMLGDHHLYRKGFGYEGSAHIPLIIADAPSAGPVHRNLVIDRVVELRDIMPTLLEMAGVPIPSSVEGLSLAPLLRGERPSWRDYLHGEHVLFGQSLQWVTDGRIKYCWASGEGTEELFDLEDDPHEMRNLAGEPGHAALRQQWRDRLIAELTGREEGFVVDGELVPVREPVSILRHTRERIAAGTSDERRC